MAEIWAFRALARLLLNVRRHQRRNFSNGRKTMAKLETFAFTVGMMLSGLLMFATLSPIA